MLLRNGAGRDAAFFPYEHAGGQAQRMMQVREHLARIEQVVGIKRAFQPLLLFRSFFSELDVHQIALFNTDAMLSGQNTTHFHTAAKNVSAKILGPFQFTGLVRIKQN